VDVVGYSAGGVVTRVWVARFGGADVARRIVTLGSPHHGTDVAQLAAGAFGSACPLACRQLAPSGEVLRDLPDAPAGPRWTSVWSTTDEVVSPPASARLAGAVDVPLQSVCPGVRVPHGALPTDPVALAVVLRALSGTGLASAPPAAECGALRTAVPGA
jgi:triacylglycerol lipase